MKPCYELNMKIQKVYNEIITFLNVIKVFCGFHVLSHSGKVMETYSIWSYITNQINC